MSDSSKDYVVVARRYRPQTFEELVGQQHITQALENAINSGRVGHAYLFTGARGVGKTSAARILAKALDCVNGPTTTPCNECDICQSVSAGGDVDVLEIDGASNRGIDEVRQLRSNANVRPSRTRFKIYIIDEVHMLTMPAFNALLKTLEEPPEHVKFIFCTTDPEKIPITVLSRCQRFDFAGIATSAIVDRLHQIAQAEGASVEPEALHLLARRASGSMRDSQSLLEQLLAFGEEKITPNDVHAMLGTARDSRLTDLVGHLVARDPTAALRELDEAITEGVDVGALLQQLVGLFRDMMARVIGCQDDMMLYSSPAQGDRLQNSGRHLGLETILAAVEILDHVFERMRQSTFSRVLLEVALVRICHLEDLEDISSLIAHLQEDAGASMSLSSGRRDIKKKISDGDENSRRAPSPVSDSTPAPPVQPLNEHSAQQVWERVVASQEDMTADHAARFHHVANSAPNRLVVFFETRYNACKSFCEQRRAKLEDALFKVTGQRVALEFFLEAGGAEPTASPRPVSRQQLLHDAANRPFVRQAVELFDAELDWVDPEPGNRTGASDDRV